MKPLSKRSALETTSIQVFVALDRAAAPGDHVFDERDAFSDDPPPPVELSWDDAWAICYTGGTTGLPKGAVLTHRAITANSVNTIVSWGLTPDDVTILNSPLFHTGGLNVFTAPLVHVGGTSIVCKGFDVDQVFDLIRDRGVTVTFGVPTMFIAMQQHPRWAEADFSKLKLIISGGAPCPLPVFEKFWERGVDFKTGYGLTEAGPNTFWLPKADVRRKPGAVGFPLFHVDVKVVNERGAECDADEVGEMLIRGPHVCNGYWNRPEETAEDHRRRLAAHRRSGAARQRRLLLHCRSQQRHDHLRRRKHLSRRSGERAARAPRRGRSRVDRRARRQSGAKSDARLLSCKAAQRSPRLNSMPFANRVWHVSRFLNRLCLWRHCPRRRRGRLIRRCCRKSMEHDK